MGKRWAVTILLAASLLPLAHAQDKKPAAAPKPAPRAEGAESAAPTLERLQLTTEKAVPSQGRIVVDPKTPEYRKVNDLAGRVRSVGSSTLSNIMNRWVQDFKLIYPKIEVDIVGGGSGTAMPALLEGRAELAPMSRPMNAKEIEQFQAKFGYPPTRLTVALDALAIYVHKDNPIKRITLKQLDAVYSNTRKRGASEAVRLWGQLGLSGDWADKDIAAKSPGAHQGVHGVFRELVLQNGEYRYDLRPELVPTSIVQAIGTDRNAIGFASYFYATQRTRPLPVAVDEGGEYVEPTQKNCVAGKYPLTRFLYLYVNKKPAVPLPALTDQLVRFICSKQGQETAARDGNYPLSAALIEGECLNNLR